VPHPPMVVYILLNDQNTTFCGWKAGVYMTLKFELGQDFCTM